MLNYCITSATSTPRTKRERIAKYYSQALHGLVNYLGAPESVIEFIEAAIIHHGYGLDEWTATGAELARAIAPASTTDQRQRIRDRLAKQRQRLAKWQGSKDSNLLSRPVIVAIRPVLEQHGETKRWQYWYSLPIAKLVQQVIEQAPVGSPQRRMEAAIATVAKDYLETTGLRPPSKVATRRHTPESQIKRGLAYLLHGISGAKQAEQDASKIVKNALLENDKLLETMELLKQTIGIILTVPDGNFPAGSPNSAYRELLNTYAQTDDGAAGRDALEQSIDDDEITELLEIEHERELIRDGSDDDDPPRSSTQDEPLFSDPARDALRIFQSVGVGCFDESTTVENRRDYVRALPVDTLLTQINERMTIQATGSPYILRPLQPAGVALIQLDDVDVGRIAELERIAFIIYQTSATKFQAWLAVAVTCDDGTRDALRRSLVDHFGADRSASGSTRWPGSLNQKYSPPYRVRILHAVLGRVLRLADLPVTPAPAPPRVATGRQLRGSGTLPDYQIELAQAPNANTADFLFALKALSSSRGCSEQEVIDALMAHSPTAKKRPKMISYTVRRAARAVTL